MKLQAELDPISAMRLEIAKISESMAKANSTIETLRAGLASTKARLDASEARCRRLDAENKALRAENSKLRDENTLLKVRVADLERRIGLDSSNSSKPPSSDGLKKPARIPARSKSGKAPGGQPNHPGATLRRNPDPEHVMDHFPAACPCGHVLSLADSVGTPAARQVVDIPEPRPVETTEHRAHSCRCPRCGAVSKAAFPAGVAAPVQYGRRIEALVAWLAAGHFVAEDRLAALASDLFSADLSAATVGSMVRRRSEALSGFAGAVGDAAKAAPVKGLDETGLRIGGKLGWLHVAATPLLTAFFPSMKRGDIVQAVGGVAVHDHFKSYFSLSVSAHALCGAHLLRELAAVAEIDKEAWAPPLIDLLKQACHLANEARRQDGSAVDPGEAAALKSEYDRRVAAGVAFHEALPPFSKDGKGARRPGHNLVLRLRGFKSAVLLFLDDPAVPFSNNWAETALRPAKTKMKVSGCFRVLGGAEAFARLRTVIETARKQGWRILDALASDSASLTARLVLA